MDLNRYKKKHENHISSISKEQINTQFFKKHTYSLFIYLFIFDYYYYTNLHNEYKKRLLTKVIYE